MIKKRKILEKGISGIKQSFKNTPIYGLVALKIGKYVPNMVILRTKYVIITIQ